MTSYSSIIDDNIGTVCNRTHLQIGSKYTGKVRDVYETEEHCVLVTTDRLSAFDRLLAVVPFKGHVLNGTSAYWFDTTKHIIPNAVVAVPHPSVTVARKCTPFKIEFVVRGYLTGTTSTSIWVHYQAGVRKYCGHALPDGMKKNERLPSVICTPTTKDDLHDRPISGEEIVREGWMSAEDWAYTEGKAIELFKHGQAVAASRGLILVDTKYEFGKDKEGVVALIDEIHTPDSSRYWLADSYEERMAAGQEPENIDKEFLRKWYRDHCDPYADLTLPEAPRDLVVELSRRYITLYEKITGKAFDFTASASASSDGGAAKAKAGDVHVAISAAVAPLFPPAPGRIVVLCGRDAPSEAAVSRIKSTITEINASANAGSKAGTTASTGGGASASSAGGAGSTVLARTKIAYEQYHVDASAAPLPLVQLCHDMERERIPSVVIVVAAGGGVDHVAKLVAAQTKRIPVILCVGGDASASTPAASASAPHVASSIVDTASTGVTIASDAASAVAAAVRIMSLLG